MRAILMTIILGFSQIAIAQKKDIPHLENINGSVQLIVNNEPFTMLAGELHNSSTGSEHYMQPIWKLMAEKNLNTVIAPISWELIEPEEGKFNFSIVDSAIKGARREGLKLVLIWFGSWKNGKSMYTPEWAKTNTKRFPLAEDGEGGTMASLSTFGVNTLKADSKAFAAFMKHIKEVDFQEQTVVMVQVENEIGSLDYRASYGMPNIYMRDYSDEANKNFNGPVPNELIDHLIKNKNQLHPALKKAWGDNGYLEEGSWDEVFGKGEKYTGDDWQNNFSYYTEELFMAWNYAKYVGEVAKLGKEEFPLPMYVNAWMKQPNGREPGQYPSGGGLCHKYLIYGVLQHLPSIFLPRIFMRSKYSIGFLKNFQHQAIL
ncbi:MULTISPECIES: beta-galactosidase [Arenibacter]|uniref:beta-galactosidase n=1 Tax=Arenibacter TaxID=178469 RepID=UPI00085584C5|nr:MULTISPECIES: beta-galactosidase [Arenibacter]GBF21135.1 beta-galactosidase precursor [Arenibacter sp. NBRC 103722]